VTTASPFGRALRHWRRLRGVSQLELAATAGTASRHVSFLETGRSRPSAAMVERLGDALGVPLREHNRLLELAGLPAAYPEGDLAADDLAPFRRVVDQLLASHDPWPAFVLDRHWDVVRANAGARRFLGDEPVPNLVDLALGEWRALVENWAAVMVALRDRIAADLLRFPDDERLRGLHDRVRDALGPRPGAAPAASGRVICPVFRIGDELVRTVTVAARFESAADVTLDEVRVELVYPEDDASAAVLDAFVASD